MDRPLDTGQFRYEIAGLRAVAVIAVVLFHLKIPGASGGFLGVDIFFVISGYLITRNIVRDIRNDRFSLAQFYIRRTRRIFPALIATVVATYMAGALWCSPLMFLDLAKECTHALLSISNIQYWRESHSYFAQKSDELAMLHCWSLSLEEQFYLLWPLLIVGAQLKRLKEVIIGATAISLGSALLADQTDPSAVFFLMPFRIYEFGCGAAVLLIEKTPRSNAIDQGASLAGLLLIVGSVIFVTPDLRHLELIGLVASVGAAAIIFAGSNTVTARLTTHPLAVGIGTISYSLYLCHWPIIFFSRFIFGHEADSLAGKAMMLAAMFAVATLMYRFIERRFIQPADAKPAGFWKYSAAFWSIIAALVAVTHSTFLSRGFAWRLPAGQAELAHLQEFPSSADVLATAAPPGMALLGDSYAVQYQAGLSILTSRLGMSMEILAKPGCPMLDGVVLKSSRRAECASARDKALDQIRKSSLPVFYAQRWDFYDDATIDYDGKVPTDARSAMHGYAKLESALNRTIAEIVGSGRRILLVGSQVSANCSINLARILPGPLPHAARPPCPPRRRTAAESDGRIYDQMLSRVRSRWPDQIGIFRPVDYLCGEECPIVLNGIWLYFESTHFSVAGSRYVVSRAETPLRAFLLGDRDGQTTDGERRRQDDIRSGDDRPALMPLP